MFLFKNSLSLLNEFLNQILLLMNKNFKRLKILPLGYLKYLHDDFGPTLYTYMSGCSVKMSSQRYKVFQKSQVCSCCGLDATYLSVELDLLLDTDRYHINMYGVDENGNEILFTKDHILPKSKGGRNHISNYQTMCVICNNNKGNDISKEPLLNVIKH